ncbi:adenylyltransferase/cytidyltransferase family protein [Microbulbifer sp. ZKSA004]|uniref:adenylyltransferase/cytidyltransferase family protein n=1 Tax=Microbulbifer sp. ZKSA004 TaxID=3243389 RepID=UPI00403A453F
MSNLIGYTTGVFDLFHVGHVNILRRAKLECDYLIVGVSTDDLVYKLKGIKPFIPFDERVEILNSIKYVDEVVPETSNDKLKAWENLKFDRIFKGDDWKGSELWNSLEIEFNKRGVDVSFFSYTKNTSSTKIRDLVNSQLVEAC